MAGGSGQGREGGDWETAQGGRSPSSLTQLTKANPLVPASIPRLVGVRAPRGLAPRQSWDCPAPDFSPGHQTSLIRAQLHP
jgi:hypothetical protein